MRLAMTASDAAMEARAPDQSAVIPALAARVCVIVTDSPPTVHVIPRGFPSNSSSSVTGWFSLTTWAPESADRDARVKQRASLVNVASKHGAPVWKTFDCVESMTSKPLLSCMQHALPTIFPSTRGTESSMVKTTIHSTASWRATADLALYDDQNPAVGRPVIGLNAWSRHCCV